MLSAMSLEINGLPWWTVGPSQPLKPCPGSFPKDRKRAYRIKWSAPGGNKNGKTNSEIQGGPSVGGSVKDLSLFCLSS
jgi:hypothetical protein